MPEKIKFAIIGCGGMAHAHANNFRLVEDAEIVALCDIKRANMEKLHREKFESNPAIRLYDSYEELLRDPPAGLRVMDIITPHTLHFPQAMAALDGGYDVLVEKPMVTSSAHARALAAKAQKTGRLLQVAFQSAYTQEFAYLRELLRSGALGEIQSVTAHSHQRWRPRDGKAHTWRHDPAMSGGGQMYDTGAHLFNAIAWLMDLPATEVFCWTDNKGMRVDINAVCTIKWRTPAGAEILGTATISGNTPGWQEGIFIAGEAGRVVTGIHGGRLEQYDAAGSLVKYPLVTQANFTPQSNFVACLQGKAEPRCPARYGVLHSWLMDGLYESAKLGRPVKLSTPPLCGKVVAAKRSPRRARVAV